jgi:hypothetical protein
VDEKEKDGDEAISWGYFVWPCVVVIVVLIVSGFAIHGSYGEKERGSFGDMFGAANALFSGFAFAGVIYAILLQRQELKLQRR